MNQRVLYLIPARLRHYSLFNIALPLRRIIIPNHCFFPYGKCDITKQVMRQTNRTLQMKMTHVGGFTMLNSSTGVVGTLLMIIFLPSVEPMPTDAQERTDALSLENWLPASLPGRPVVAMELGGVVSATFFRPFRLFWCLMEGKEPAAVITFGSRTTISLLSSNSAAVCSCAALFGASSSVLAERPFCLGLWRFGGLLAGGRRGSVFLTLFDKELNWRPQMSSCDLLCFSLAGSMIERIQRDDYCDLR